MAVKTRKVVDITKDDEKTTDKFGKDSKGNIIKLEEKGDSRKRATTRRIIAVVLWVLAIACEVIGILRLNGTINWFSNLSTTTFLIIAIVCDLVLFIPGSLLWKKANHIDPISEKDKTRFWIHNNLGTILSVLAFLPIIIFVLTNKDMDKKSKTIVSIVAAVAMVIAGVTSYDFNPVSSEQLLRAEKEVQAVSETGKVYWAPNSKKYHVDPDCPAFSRSETIIEGTVRQAYENNLTEPCRRCIPELEEEHDHTEEEE